MSLKNRVAIVTGGAQGIGRAVAERFIEEDISAVVIVDINQGKVYDAAKEITDIYGGEVLPLHADVSDSNHVKKVVKTTIERYGQVDILVNNAGVCPVTSWDEVTLDSWNRVLSINLTGSFLFTHAVIPSMKSNQYGRIIFIASEGAFGGSLIAHVAYGVSKAGLITLMKSVAKGFANDGILVNAVSPGPVETAIADSLGKEFWAAADQKTLLKRHANASEIADAVLFFAGNQSTYITGQVLRVNGGMDLT